MQKFYVGTLKTGGKIIFKTDTTPTKETHGEAYKQIRGPYKTKRAALFYVGFNMDMP